MCVLQSHTRLYHYSLELAIVIYITGIYILRIMEVIWIIRYRSGVGFKETLKGIICFYIRYFSAITQSSLFESLLIIYFQRIDVNFRRCNRIINLLLLEGAARVIRIIRLVLLIHTIVKTVVSIHIQFMARGICKTVVDIKIYIIPASFA